MTSNWRFSREFVETWVERLNYSRQQWIAGEIDLSGHREVVNAFTAAVDHYEPVASSVEPEVSEAGADRLRLKIRRASVAASDPARAADKLSRHFIGGDDEGIVRRVAVISLYQPERFPYWP